MHSPAFPSTSPPPTMQPALVLIAEDEPEIREILCAYLGRSGLRSLTARDGREALQLHATHRPDLLLLDVNMPEVDGWQVLAELRHRGQTPVIMLTAADQDVDKLMALRIGADDYVVKPFNPAEVVARVQAVLRRARPAAGEARDMLRAGDFQIDLLQHEATVRVAGQPHVLSLTLTEFRLLAHLARAPRRVFSRLELLEGCLPEGDALERTVDSHISKLRRKLEALGLDGVPVAVRGIGYRLLGAS